MKSSLLLLLLMAIPAVTARGQQPSVLEQLQQTYKPWLGSDDSLTFAMKIRAISSDPYTFWRGTKLLYFRWCKENCADWLADQQAYMPCHADLHFGNIGTYMTGWKQLGFGMVDFDDSARIPFQLELLQGLVSIRLAAIQNQIPLNFADRTEIDQAILHAVIETAASDQNAMALLSDDKTVKKLMKRSSSDYSEELERLTKDGHFRPLIISKGNPKEILTPAMDRADAFADAIVQAIQNAPQFGGLFRLKNAAEIRASIRDVARRTRLGSSGSQGLNKYLVLLHKPLSDHEDNAVVYLKQEIPTAAERAGVIPMETIPPGERLHRDMNALTDPKPLASSWCRVGDESYWVTLKEPWSDELDSADFDSKASLIELAHIWGTVAAAAHPSADRHLIAERTAGLGFQQLQDRADALVKFLQENYTALRADPQAQALCASANQLIQSKLAQP